MRRCLALLLLLPMLLTPLTGRAQTAGPEAPAAAETSVLPRIAANAAVYGSLYAVAVTLVQVTSTAMIAQVTTTGSVIGTGPTWNSVTLVSGEFMGRSPAAGA